MQDSRFVPPPAIRGPQLHRRLLFKLPLAVFAGLVVITMAEAPLTGQICTGTAPPCVLTAGYAGPASDVNFNSRQAINPYETTFSPTSLPGSTTGTLFEVDDSATALIVAGATSNPIMAQPLYIAGITTTLGTCSGCNMLVAVTLNGTVFAWVADGMGAGNLLWSRQGTPGVGQGNAGYGYLMTQGNLCGVGSTDTNCIGFASGDPGSLMTFGASQILCNAYPDNCDRVATMALFDNRGTGSGRAVYLNYWPNNERLTSLRMSDDATWINAAGTQELTWTSGTSQTLNLNGTCTANTNCLPDQIVAGDSLQLSPCGCGTSGCPVVTTVAATSLTINMTVATAFSSSCTAPQSFEYEGYFVKPAHDHTPTVSSGGYPGAAVTVTANCTSPPCTNALVWAVLPGSDSQADTLMRGLGTVYAYTALPNSYDLLANDWSSTDTWCASSFARPTIVNAGAFVPTYAVSTGGRSFPGGTCPTTSTSGIPYPSGILVYH
jgi:hypothetical protein